MQLLDGYDHAAVYASIVAKYHNLTEVSGRQIDENGLRALGMVYESTLTSVEFTKASFTGGALFRLCKGCPNLTNLLLTSEFDSEVTDEDVRSIAKCPQLESLSLAKCTKITDAAIDTLILLPALREINISHCSGLTSSGVQNLLRSNRNLELIILSEYFDVSFCEFCDDEFLYCTSECCPKLRDFAVDIDPESTVVSEASLIALFRGCPLLENLVLYYEQLSDSCLSALAASCSDLKELTLVDGSYTDTGVIAVCSNCTGLKYLELHGPPRITDISLICIAEHCSLKHLHLLDTTAVTDRGLCLLFEACTGLLSVELDGLPLITDRSIISLFRFCPKLSDLTLNSNIGLSEKAVLGLIGLECGGGIETLKFEHCTYITDNNISIVALHCSKLKGIKLTDCPLVTAEGLIALLTHSKHLTHVEILDCDIELTDAMIDTHLARRSSSRRIRVELGEVGAFAM